MRKPWLVIRPDDREQVVATVCRPPVRATVSASLADVRAWAHEHGVPDQPGDYRHVVDAYIAAQYEAEP